jgi:PhnB protein
MSGETMTSQLNPYLAFSSEARAALEFYRDVFGGDLSITTFGQFGMSEEGQTDLVMHGQLSTERGFTLMASDAPAHMEVTPGTNITICLSGDDVESLRDYWAKLSAEGTVATPLEKQMWGDEFGACQDKFGIPWMVNIAAGETGS